MENREIDLSHQFNEYQIQRFEQLAANYPHSEFYADSEEVFLKENQEEILPHEYPVHKVPLLMERIASIHKSIDTKLSKDVEALTHIYEPRKKFQPAYWTKGKTECAFNDGADRYKITAYDGTELDQQIHLECFSTEPSDGLTQVVERVEIKEDGSLFYMKCTNNENTGPTKKIILIDNDSTHTIPAEPYHRARELLQKYLQI